MSAFNASTLFTLGQKTLLALSPEAAHGASITALRAGIYPRFYGAEDTRLNQEIAGISFPNPLGMAAGYDKGADVPDALLSMGFGHTEIGTITPLPQPGNPKPRIFRLEKDQAVINRLGFNSGGHAAALAKLEQRGRKAGILGVNIGANKSSDDFASDYVTGIGAFAEFATYFTINISSPNTPGLRQLQGSDPLQDLLTRVEDARSQAEEASGRRLPLFLKIAPDLNENELDDIAKALGKSSFDGLITSNTTLSREGLQSNNRDEVGGLSGQPVFERSTIVLAKMRQRLASDFPIIGVGGVCDAQSALTKIKAGASLVQLYTGMIYKGPNLPGQIIEGLSRYCDNNKLAGIHELVGQDSEEWANKEIPA